MHLRLLTLRPANDTSLLPALEYLDHSIDRVPLDAGAVLTLSGIEVLLIDATQDLREASATARIAAANDANVPVLIIMPDGALAALKASWGFDDFISPNAQPAELETRLRLARERAALMHPQRAARIGELSIDEESYQVKLGHEPLDLTYKEFELLRALANAPNRVFTREVLLHDVWGYDYFGGSRTVDVHIRRLRAKLGPEFEQMIVTVRGVGYKLVPPGTRTSRGSEDAEASS